MALVLHGAGVVDGAEDMEGDLARQVRAVIGDRPLVAPFDLHGNVSDSMAALFDVMLPCHLYPHTDMEARGLEAVRLLPALLDGSLQAVRARRGRLSALSVSHSKSVLYGGFVWARRALNSQKRRFLAPPGRCGTRPGTA